MALPATQYFTLYEATPNSWRSWFLGTIIGVPDPLWTNIDPLTIVTPSQPGGWPANEVSNYYYIDNTHGSAVDVGNTFGYPNRPRLTIPTTLSAGAYVEIAGGPYTANQLIITANGTVDNPVWIIGDTGNRPIIRKETILKGQYIFLEGIKYDTNEKGLSLRSHNGSTLNHVCVRDCEFAGPGTSLGTNFASCIAIYGPSSSNRFTDIVIYNNLIHDFGDDDSLTENDYHGVEIPTNADRVWVLGNTIYNMGGDSVQVGIATTATANYVRKVFVADNDCYGNFENAIDIKKAYDVVISSNLLHDCPCTCVVHNDPNGVWIINNRLYTTALAISNTSALNCNIIGNIIHDVTHIADPWEPDNYYASADGSCINIRGNSTGIMSNNTFVAYDLGIQLASGTGYTVTNNYFNGSQNALGHDLSVVSTAIFNASTIDNNTHVDVYGSKKFLINGTEYTLAALQAAFPTQAQNSLMDTTSKLTLVGAPADLYKLAADATSVDAGASIDAMQAEYLATFGTSLNREIFNNARNQGAAPDVGAHEVA